MSDVRLSEVQDTVSQCRYLDWQFEVKRHEQGFLYLQVVFHALDNETGQMSRQCGRKWVISDHATTTEIVNTAWFAVKTAVEHEAREAFKYCGKAIYNTHLDVAFLMWIADKCDRRKR